MVFRHDGQAFSCAGRQRLFCAAVVTIADMTGAETIEFERQVAARGWRYDEQSELFMDGDRVVDFEDVIALVPGMTPEDMAAYRDDKWDQLSAAQQRNSQAGK